ncbi:FHA domain-containing protein [Allostreptomyces psammosilenae]|uniref:FHA domain-containing protein n=1 Tax=Allostreptomyces psammosilenae TaxID=1892865 RepID=A0A853A1S1_9ACTN|nr:FHA domain-containing protein [Allostreptomyces psammosilenae]NYI08365.1 hypothetical protein [Allostreptomyces psammosilenae]
MPGPGGPGGPEQGPPQQAQWTAVINADWDYFQAVLARSGPEAQGLFFPPYCPERRIPLTGRQVRIGRYSASRGERPEIDLAEAPADPGVSHVHATLVLQADGSWAVVDLESTNGTTINGAVESLPSHQPFPLRPGDRVHVGAWTTITLHRG